MMKCNGSVKKIDAKPTYKIFIDWVAKKKYQCDLCEYHYENLENFHQHFFEDHKSKNTPIRSKAIKDDSYNLILKTDDNQQDLNEADPLQLDTEDYVNNDKSSLEI